MDSAGTVPTVTKIHDLYELPTADTSRSSFVHSGLSQTEYNSNAPWALVRDAPVEGESLDSCVTPGIAQHSAHLGRCALSHGRGLAPTTGGGGATPVTGVLRVDVLRVGRDPRRGPPFCSAGTERPLPRPQDPTPQKTWHSGKKKRHLLKKLMLIDAALRILFLTCIPHIIVRVCVAVFVKTYHLATLTL